MPQFTLFGIMSCLVAARLGCALCSRNAGRLSSRIISNNEGWECGRENAFIFIFCSATIDLLGVLTHLTSLNWSYSWKQTHFRPDVVQVVCTVHCQQPVQINNRQKYDLTVPASEWYSCTSQMLTGTYCPINRRYAGITKCYSFSLISPEYLWILSTLW